MNNQESKVSVMKPRRTYSESESELGRMSDKSYKLD